MSIRRLPAVVTLTGMLVSMLVAAPPAAADINFLPKSALAGASVKSPTSLQFGPDGRLYVGQQDGTIKVFKVKRDGKNDYSANLVDTIVKVKSIPNHNDNGNPNGGVNERLLTGILVAGTKAAPVIYATSSDPRIGGGQDGTDLPLDTNSGTISRLTWNGSDWMHKIVVAGLPRSEENHASNGMALNTTTNMLYVAQGGNTNAGGPSFKFAELPEYALSAAILSVDLDAIGNTRYDIPTLNDPDRPGTDDANDPWGGNDGKNQAKVVAGGPVKVFSPGFRNPYDIVLTSKGKLFVPDNGPNKTWGGPPANEGPGGNCTNAVVPGGDTGSKDSLHLVSNGYYGGHANPTRGNDSNTFGGQSPVPSENPVECDFRGLDDPANEALADLDRSSNGIDEYTTDNFGGDLQGDLLTVSWATGAVTRIDLNATGTGVLGTETLFSNVGAHPLDLTINDASDPFPGTVWVADWADGISVFEPADFGGGGGGGGCTGANDPSLDEDGDGYSNRDEIRNGTDPCNGGSVPPDADGDHVSDLLDKDDDDDGLRDGKDPFALDRRNGRTTRLPVRLTWENTGNPLGGMGQTGFTGLMTNGKDYLSKFDTDNMVVGGAAGVLTVEEVPPGDALAKRNSQRYGFQLGVRAPKGRFTVSARILTPFEGLAPKDHQSMGLFVGSGTQGAYAKLVVQANGGTGGIGFVKETKNVVRVERARKRAMPGPDAVDLYLTIRPSRGTVQAAFRIVGADGSAGPLKTLGRPVAIPRSWYASGSRGLAVGVISTSRGSGETFGATWDSVRVRKGRP